MKQRDRRSLYTRIYNGQCHNCHKIKSVVRFGTRLPTCSECCIALGWLKIINGQEFWNLPVQKKAKAPGGGTAIGLLKVRLTGALHRAASLIKRFPDDKEAFNLTMSHMIYLYTKQEGKCAITGREMTLGRVGTRLPDRDALSIDRIDASKGYLIGNVRLVTFQANAAKNRFSDSEFLAMCRDVISVLGKEARNEPDSIIPNVPTNLDYGLAMPVNDILRAGSESLGDLTPSKDVLMPPGVDK